MLTTDVRGPADELAPPPAGRPEAAPPLRVAVGLGDAERELGLLVAFNEGGDIVVTERCLAAEQLLECARRGQVDVLLVALDLHRLDENVLAEIAQTGAPLVLLAPSDVSAASHATFVLPPDADVAAVREGLLSAARGERARPMLAPEPERPETPAAPRAADRPAAALAVLAIASGHGSPGRTTLAVNLSAGLGLVAPVVLVDADLGGPSVAAHLDLDPTRNLYMVAHAEPESPRDWDRVLAQELQPLAPGCPQALVLCGVPKPEMRPAVTPRFLERLVRELRQRYQHVVLDLGADLLGAETAAHRAALGLADKVLLAASGDVVGLWHARTALGLLRGQLGVATEKVALVLNRHDRHFHHGRAEIEWELRLTTAAVIPYDHSGAERAIAEHRPMALDGRSRAGFYLLELAGRVHGRRIELPPERRPAARQWASSGKQNGRPPVSAAAGVSDGDRLPA